MKRFLFILGLIFILAITKGYSKPIKYSNCYCNYAKCNCSVYYSKKYLMYNNPYYDFERTRRYMRNNYEYRYYYQRYPNYPRYNYYRYY